MENLCFLFGDPDTPYALFPTLLREIEREIEQGVTVFCVERKGNFCRMAVRALQILKRRHSGISALMMPLYDRPGSDNPVPPGFDGTFFPFNPKPGDTPEFFYISITPHMFVVSESIICYAVSHGRPMRLFQMAIKWHSMGYLRLKNLCLTDET